MSLQDYKASLLISSNKPSFDSLIFAAMRAANSYNLSELQKAFPSLWNEFLARYHSPSGCLNDAELQGELEFWNRSGSNA